MSMEIHDVEYARSASGWSWRCATCEWLGTGLENAPAAYREHQAHAKRKATA